MKIVWGQMKPSFVNLQMVNGLRGLILVMQGVLKIQQLVHGAERRLDFVMTLYQNLEGFVSLDKMTQDLKR